MDHSSKFQLIRTCTVLPTNFFTVKTMVENTDLAALCHKIQQIRSLLQGGKGIGSTHGYPWKLHDCELVKCLTACFWQVASQKSQAAQSWIRSPALTVERQLVCKSAEAMLILCESHPQSFSGPPNPPKGNIHLWKAECCCFKCLLFSNNCNCNSTISKSCWNHSRSHFSAMAPFHI